jgi:hypothetical protein
VPQAKREDLLSVQDESKRNAKILHALLVAAKQYRDQIRKGLQGNQAEASRARVTVRQLLGKEITLKPTVLPFSK